MAPFDVGDQGRMAVFIDPAGAFISAWQGTRMGGFQTDAPNSFGWAELNARGVDNALPFYAAVFGWTVKTSPMGEGQPDYNEFQIGGKSVAGAWEMNPSVPARSRATGSLLRGRRRRCGVQEGARPRRAGDFAPTDYPGGRFAIVSDPQGASFGLLKTSQR